MDYNSVYDYLIDSVFKGAHYDINLKTKSLKVDKKTIIDNGCYDTNRFKKLIIYEYDYQYHPWEYVKKLYKSYYTSIPGETRLGNKPYFHAMDVNNLPDQYLSIAMSRNYAQALLEGWILCASLDKVLTWEWDPYWFVDLGNNLIMLKEWL